MDDGSSVIIEMPGFTTADAGAEQSSLAALRAASEMSYYKDDETLWVKLVAANDGDGSAGGFGAPPSVTVSR